MIQVIKVRTIAALVLAASGLVASAAEAPTPAYIAAMKTLATVATEMPKKLAASDPDGMDRLVIEARPAIAVVEEYWNRRGTKDAIELAAAVSKAIAEISVAVHLLKESPNPLAVEGAEQSIATLTAACAACHNAHREKLPDGTFAIK